MKNRATPGAQAGWLYYLKRSGRQPAPVTGRMCHGCHEAANEEHPYFDKNKKGLFRDCLFSPVLKGGETKRE